MYCDYELYRAYCYNGAVMFGILFSFAFVACIISVIIAVRKRLALNKICIYSFFSMFFGILVCTSVGQLLYGGIYLYNERETDAVEIQGEITNIKGLGEFSFPRIKGNYTYEEKNGYAFTINGVQCTFIIKGSLVVGDYVTVKYLPKSRYILYIAETD